MLRPASLLLVLLPTLATVGAVACATNRDLGVGTTTTTGSGGATTTHATGTGGTKTTATGTGGAVEPSGPTALTIVNGINDYPAARFCFLPGDTPWPAAATGLPFAAGQAVDIATALPPGVDVTPWVIVGDLAVTAGLTCSQMLALAQPIDDGGAGGSGAGGGDAGSGDAGSGDGGAPAPPVIAAALGVIPQAVLTSDKSLLLVPEGCLGGAGHTDPNQSAGCGSMYSPTSPTNSVVLVAMSRIPNAAAISLQAVSASVVLPASDVRVLPSAPNGMTAMEVALAPALSPGGIGPFPPFDQLRLSDYGTVSAVQIETYTPGTSTKTSSIALSGLLSASAVGIGGFTDGASLVLVAVGGAPGAVAGPFWHAFTYAVVKADPG